MHGVLQISFNFIQNVLRSTSQDNRTGFGILALGQVAEPIVTNLAHFKQSTTRSQICFLNFVRATDNSGTDGSGNAVVVRLAQATKGGNIGLGQIVLRQITHTLFGNDNVGLVRNDITAHVGHVFFFQLQQSIPILVVGDFHIGLRFALFVFEWCIEQENARVDNFAPHAGVHGIFLEHDALEHLGIGNFATGNLFHLGVAFQVHFYIL